MDNQIREDIHKMIDEIIAANPHNWQALCDLLYVLRRNKYDFLRSVMVVALAKESALRKYGKL